MKKLLFLLPLFFTACTGMINSNKDILQDDLKYEQVLLAVNDYDALIKEQKAKLAKEPSDINRLKLAKLYYEAKDYESASYYLASLTSAEALLYKAYVTLEQKKYKECIDLTKSINDTNKLAKAANLAGICYVWLKDFDNALKSFYLAKDLYLDDEIVNNNIAMLYLSQNNYEKAILFLKALYERNQHNKTIINNYIIALVKNKQYKKALNVANTAKIPNARKLIKELANSDVE